MSNKATTTQPPPPGIFDGDPAAGVAIRSVVADRLAREGETDLAEVVRTGDRPLDAAQLFQLEKFLTESEHASETRAREQRLAMDEARTLEVLTGKGAAPTAGELLKLGKRLAASQRIGSARRVLKLAVEFVKKMTDAKPELRREILQKSAVFTYKDKDLPTEWALDRALKILHEGDDLGVTRIAETLGIAGAIYKRKWEVDGQRVHLERALFFYLRGYSQGAEDEAGRADVLAYLRAGTRSLKADDDRGYCGINAAFLLDVMAELEDAEAQRAGLHSSVSAQRRAEARLIREEIVRTVPPLVEKQRWLAREWWFYATIGEALFGLERYTEAVEWLIELPPKKGLTQRKVADWEYESTARQLARLARLHCDRNISEAEFAESRAGQALKVFLRDDDKAMRSAFRGKFGLGLSGGGFRASLFHIGVLARLAELDVLRHVEVLSCVSGGSIIGAHYYLELRRLLQAKEDDEITAEDYVKIVQRVEAAFLKGVQRNLRTRVLAEWTSNVRMIFEPGYSRTKRIGELYERELYSHIGEDVQETASGSLSFGDGPGQKGDPLWLNELKVFPLKDGTAQKSFNPREHNWRREHKVPILILNAATLNTGHNWQFTATFMGEPPSPIDVEIDANYRLRRMYYDDAPSKYQNIRLGDAVAASSCVPGLFEPLILDGLYEGQSVRLVDGGVCDNQGVASLLEQDCTVLLVSDASGQMDADPVPSRGVLGVPLRTNSILQARVREGHYDHIAARRRASQLRGLMFIHLKQGLLGAQVPWLKCPPHLKESEFESSVQPTGFDTGYGVDVDIQRRLAALRTDLDSFNDQEAFALMNSGYLMTAKQFAPEGPCLAGFSEVARGKWRFAQVAAAMKPRGTGDERGREELDRVLEAGASCAFKVWKLSCFLRVVKWVLLAGVLTAVGWLFYDRWELQLLSARWEAALTYKRLGLWIVTLVGFVLLAAGLKALVGLKLGDRLMRIVRWRETVNYLVLGLAMSMFGFLIARLHLHIFDRLFLCLGKLKKLPKQ